MTRWSYIHCSVYFIDCAGVGLQGACDTPAALILASKRCRLRPQQSEQFCTVAAYLSCDFQLKRAVLLPSCKPRHDRFRDLEDASSSDRDFLCAAGKKFSLAVAARKLYIGSVGGLFRLRCLCPRDMSNKVYTQLFQRINPVAAWSSAGVCVVCVSEIWWCCELSR